MVSQDNLKIGISLSGGGVRAAAFHLGILARLSDEKLLEKIRMLSTVSGGSLVTGLIYKSNNYKWPTSEEFQGKSIPLVKYNLTHKNLQLRTFLRILSWPFSLITAGRAGIVSKSLQSVWGIRAKLNDIESWPRWNITATAIESGKSWRFIPQERMGDYVLNHVEKPAIDLSDALCSSAAVPFLIGPYTIKTSKFVWYKYQSAKDKVAVSPPFKKIHIWDGGAYDNLGVEPLAKFNDGIQYRKEINFLIVSDAAQEIVTAKRQWYNPMRLIDVTMDQVRAIRSRVLFDHFKSHNNAGVYFKIGETVESIKTDSKTNFQGTISQVGLTPTQIADLKDYPTNLWKMEEKDFAGLFRHGWEVANATLVLQCPEMFQNKEYRHMV